MKRNLILRKLQIEDVLTISDAFKSQGWKKPVDQYQAYIRLQHEGLRDVVVAELNREFVGYLTIKWESDYKPFKEKNIPEIVDLNVLKKFQRQGIATAMMVEAEKRIKKVSTHAGIGFGVTQEYGPAQILYIKRNYLPDGNGIANNGNPLNYDDKVVINDDIVMYLTKKL